MRPGLVFGWDTGEVDGALCGNENRFFFLDVGGDDIGGSITPNSSIVSAVTGGEMRIDSTTGGAARIDGEGDGCGVALLRLKPRSLRFNESFRGRLASSAAELLSATEGKLHTEVQGVEGAEVLGVEATSSTSSEHASDEVVVRLLMSLCMKLLVGTGSFLFTQASAIFSDSVRVAGSSVNSSTVGVLIESMPMADKAVASLLPVR